jgi:hypothetical protein
MVGGCIIGRRNTIQFRMSSKGHGDLMVSLHALHAHQSKLPGNFDMQGVVLGVPRTHANQFTPSPTVFNGEKEASSRHDDFPPQSWIETRASAPYPGKHLVSWGVKNANFVHVF